MIRECVRGRYWTSGELRIWDIVEDVSCAGDQELQHTLLRLEDQQTLTHW